MKLLRLLIFIFTVWFSPLNACGAAGPVSELVGGAEIPIPPPMAKATDQPMELMIPGFQGGQVAYRGDMPPREVIAFYRDQMPRLGWTPYAALVSAQGLLVFTKEHQSVLIMVSENNGSTTLAILAGSTGAN